MRMLLLLIAVPLGQLLGQQCPDGGTRGGTIGLGMLVCVTEEVCMVRQRVAAGVTHQFSVEPRIARVVPGSPADGQLKAGDVIVAIDGAFITTAEGGRRLANLSAGRPIVLRIRRPGEDRDLYVRLLPQSGCDAYGLAVMTRGEPLPSGEDTVSSPIAPSVELGMELDCERCGWSRQDGATVMRFSGPVMVRAVSPAGPAAVAGVAPGDRLLEVDGMPLDSDQAARLLGRARPGAPLRFLISRNAVTRIVTIIPRAAGRGR